MSEPIEICPLQFFRAQVDFLKCLALSNSLKPKSTKIKLAWNWDGIAGAYNVDNFKKSENKSFLI